MKHQTLSIARKQAEYLNAELSAVSLLGKIDDNTRFVAEKTDKGTLFKVFSKGDGAGFELQESFIVEEQKRLYDSENHKFAYYH